MRVLPRAVGRAWRNATERPSPLPCPYGPRFASSVWRLATYGGLGRDDRASGRVHDDGADVRAVALRVEVVQRDRPDGLRWDALLEEADLGLLRVGLPVVPSDLDRLLARHVPPGRAASARDERGEEQRHEQHRPTEPPAVAEVPDRGDARARRVA